MASNITATERLIITYFYSDVSKNTVVKTNRSKYSRSAVMRALDLMSMNYYGAQVAVVFDDEHGSDHAIITRHMDGRIETVFKRDPTIPAYAQFGKFTVLKYGSSKTKIKNSKASNSSRV